MEYNYHIKEQDDGSWIIFDPFGHKVQHCATAVEAAKVARELCIAQYKKAHPEDEDA